MLSLLSGDEAREYMRQTESPEVTPGQQKALFIITYAEIEAAARKLCTSPEVGKAYGPVDWDKLHPARSASWSPTCVTGVTTRPRRGSSCSPWWSRTT
jgi:hypothetical protein